MQADGDHSRRSIVSPAVAGILVVHAVPIGIQAVRNAPNLDECAHIAAGLCHWETGDWDVYSVNPPLIRCLAVLPLLVERPQTDWNTGTSAKALRREFSFADRMVVLNGDRMFLYVKLARFALLPLTVLAGVVLYLWGCDLFGECAGLLVVLLWCFSPEVLSWGASITPDAGGAACGVLAAWFFRRWLRVPSWRNTGYAGASLGLALLAKSTWIVLFVVWPAIWMALRWLCRDINRQPHCGQMFGVMCLGISVVNAGYSFSDTGMRLDEFRFVSRLLTGQEMTNERGNRFAESWVGRVPVIVPASFVRGADIQKHEFEVKKWSWLRGRQREGGWWYYYLYAFAVKTPGAWLALAGFAIWTFLVRPESRAGWLDELLIAVPILAVLLLVSSQTGFSRHFRYVLPVMPFMFLYLSRLAIHWKGQATVLSGAVTLMVAAGLCSSLSVFPYCHSYFNALAGGPWGGRFHLLDSNIDWGQDLLQLRRWVETHPDASPLYAALTTSDSIRDLAVECEPIPDDQARRNSRDRALRPGWYAVSVNHLMGYRIFGAASVDCRQFQKMQPVDHVGYSIYLYHIE